MHLAAPWLARAIGVDLHGSPEIRVGLGGATRRAGFADVTLRLIAPDGTAAVEWQADVGFIESWEPPWGLSRRWVSPRGVAGNRRPRGASSSAGSIPARIRQFEVGPKAVEALARRSG